MTEIPPVQESIQPQTVKTPKNGKGLAITALVLGILSIICIISFPYIPCFSVLVGISAFIMGIIVFARNKPGKGMAIAGLVMGVASIILLSSFGRAREPAKRAICGTNLYGISQGLEIYLTSHQATYPPTLKHLIQEGQPENIFVCPSTGNTEPFDYFYLPPVDNAPEDTILACDYFDNHRGECRNVLFLDGQVERIQPEEEFQKLLKEPQNAAFAAALKAAEAKRKLKDNR